MRSGPDKACSGRNQDTVRYVHTVNMSAKGLGMFPQRRSLALGMFNRFVQLSEEYAEMVKQADMTF
jgi:hypothetical protein